MVILCGRHDFKSLNDPSNTLVRPGRIFDYAAIANGNFGADLVSAGVLGLRWRVLVGG